MHQLHSFQPRPAVRAARGAGAPAVPRGDAAHQVLRLTARLWLPAALLRTRPDGLPLDERVRQSGEW
jgi:hypothetical protein